MKYFLSGITQGIFAGALVAVVVFYSLIRATPPVPQSVIFDAVRFDAPPSILAVEEEEYLSVEHLQQSWNLFRMVMEFIAGCAECDEKKWQEISPYFSKEGWKRFLEKQKAEPLSIRPFSSWPQAILSPEEVDGVKCQVLMLDYNAPQQDEDDAKNTPAYRIKMLLRFDEQRAFSGQPLLIEDIRWEKVRYGRK